jgi:hypothetical protein
MRRRKWLLCFVYEHNGERRRGWVKTTQPTKSLAYGELARMSEEKEIQIMKVEYFELCANPADHIWAELKRSQRRG